MSKKKISERQKKEGNSSPSDNHSQDSTQRGDSIIPSFLNLFRFFVPRSEKDQTEDYYIRKVFDEKIRGLLHFKESVEQSFQKLQSQPEREQKQDQIEKENQSFNQDIGRPLVVQIHEKQHNSYLADNADTTSYRGLVNLLVLILLSYTIRSVIENYQRHDWIILQEVRDYIKSEKLYDPANYQTVAALILLLTFPAFSFWIEIMASTKIKRELVYGLIVLNLTANLVYPIVASWSIHSHPAAATLLMMFTCGQVLKLISFHHIMHDNRVMIRRLERKIGDSDDQVEENVYNLPPEQQQEALKYPNNINFRHYVRYLVSPTCCFQFSYPSTERRRIGYIIQKLIEFILLNLLIAQLFYQHMLPVAKEAVVPLRERDYFKVLFLTLQMSVPAAYLWLTMFYSFFHSYMNMWGEITMFADRRFYSDFWNAGDLNEYWRKWNFPIHSFLIRHVYFPLRRRKVIKPVALFLTFFVSAIAHEYIVVGVFRVFNFIAFFLMIVNVPIMVIQHKLKGVVHPNTNNIIFWLGYIILGQPFGIILCYYQYNY